MLPYATERIADRADARELTAGRLLDILNDALFVDDECYPTRGTELLVVYTVPPGDFALRMEIGEQRDTDAECILPGLVAEERIDRDAEDSGSSPVKLLVVFSVGVHLVRAAGTPVQRVEVQDDFLPPECRQRHLVAVSRLQREIRCLSADREWFIQLSYPSNWLIAIHYGWLSEHVWPRFRSLSCEPLRQRSVLLATEDGMAFQNSEKCFYHVAIQQVGDDVTAALAGAFDLLDTAGEPTLSGRTVRLVTIKVNLTAPRPSGSGVVTDAAVVEAFIRVLRERVPDIQRIVVADGPGMARAEECFAVAGYERLGTNLGAELLDLNDAPTRTTNVPGWLRYPTLEIPEVVLDADLFVSITPPKTHTDGLYTLHAKNLYGVPPNRFYGRPRKAFHKVGVSEVVHDINRACPIDLAITDGLAGTQLGDPIDGERVELGVVAVGWNAQAVDVVGCGLMRVDPRRSTYLSYLRAAGYGPLSPDEIEISGVGLETVSKPFATPDRRQTRPKSELDSAH